MTERMVIFFDIDGTLLPPGASAIPASAAEAIRVAQARGHLAFINTGRTIANINTPLREFGFDGIVSGCGMMATMHGETLWQNPIDPAFSRRVIGLSRACGIKAHYEGYEAMAFDTFKNPITEEERPIVDLMRSRGKKVVLLDEADNFPLVKFIVDRSHGGDFERFRAALPEFAFVRIDDRWTECVPVGVTKGAAIERVMAHLGLPLTEAIAVGDSANDLTMFEVCPNSVAMGGSAAAGFDVSYVTRAIDDDGIAHMLRHFGLCD